MGLELGMTFYFGNWGFRSVQVNWVLGAFLIGSAPYRNIRGFMGVIIRRVVECLVLQFADERVLIT